MSNQTQKKPRPSKLPWILAFLAVWGLVGGVVLTIVARNLSRENATRAEIQIITTAMQAYCKTNGVLPAGDNHDIFNALAGSNANKTVFLVAIRTNLNGEVLDSWQTPFRIQKSGLTNFTVRSAGKNKAFGDEDDIVSE